MKIELKIDCSLKTGIVTALKMSRCTPPLSLCYYTVYTISMQYAYIQTQEIHKLKHFYSTNKITFEILLTLPFTLKEGNSCLKQ